jgi:hypothetical protein
MKAGVSRPRVGRRFLRDHRTRAGVEFEPSPTDPLHLVLLMSGIEAALD